MLSSKNCANGIKTWSDVRLGHELAVITVHQQQRHIDHLLEVFAEVGLGERDDADLMVLGSAEADRPCVRGGAIEIAGRQLLHFVVQQEQPVGQRACAEPGDDQSAAVVDIVAADARGETERPHGYGV
jgi:hypothetical protein